MLLFVVLAMRWVWLSVFSPTKVADTSKTLSGAEIERIIKAFRPRKRVPPRAHAYAFKRDALLQTVGMGAR